MKRVAQADFSPGNLHQEEEMVDENPYAEIKHFQNKRAPPPRLFTRRLMRHLILINLDFLSRIVYLRLWSIQGIKYMHTVFIYSETKNQLISTATQLNDRHLLSGKVGLEPEKMRHDGQFVWDIP